MRWWIAHRDALRFMKSRSVAYVTGCGRSGTRWVAATFSQHEGVRAEHEPLWMFDYCNHLIKDRREYAAIHRTMLFYRWALDGRKTCVETNPMLWRVADLLDDAGEQVVLLVRDPRHVISSMLWRSHYKEREAPSQFTVPGETRVERLCAFWELCVTTTAKAADATFRIEDLSRDFGEWGRLSGLVGVEPDRRVWERERRRKHNAGPRTTHPDFDREAVEGILGSAMEKYGYA